MYLPQGTQKGKGALFSSAGKTGIDLTLRAMDFLTECDQIVVGGDFNESFSDERRPTRKLPPPTFLNILTGDGGLVDLPRERFPNSENTFFYKHKKKH